MPRNPFWWLILLLFGLAALFVKEAMPQGLPSKEIPHIWVHEHPAHGWCCGDDDCHFIDVTPGRDGWEFRHPLNNAPIVHPYGGPMIVKVTEDGRGRATACFKLTVPGQPVNCEMTVYDPVSGGTKPGRGCCFFKVPEGS